MQRNVTLRCAHEEIERLERLAVKDLQHEPSMTRERLFQNHRVRGFVDKIIHTTDELVELYDDKDNLRKDEIAALGGQTASGQNVFSSFYDRLKEIYVVLYLVLPYIHREAEVTDAFTNYDYFGLEDGKIQEAFGRYLDMHGLYNEYINSKFGEKIEYSVSRSDQVSNKHKYISGKVEFVWKVQQYREYLDHVLDYLTSFFQRTEPLQDVEAEFEERWADGKVHGWEGKGLENGNSTNQGAIIDLDYYDNADELVSLGPEKLKEALAAFSLKSGGTVQQRAERLFLTKILTEVKMQRLCELLDETIVRTKENVEKKQALTYEEMEAEREEEEVQAESDSDEDEQQIYNPLKLPMGWDGKPIPYWLYKLHGLGQEFKCEICGNHSYWGRRAFERHFKEWRHQHGMRCFGIPNTKNFNEITSIKSGKVNKWRPELEEEYEDKDGNIYNKKTFTDLRRQGLI
ncbi:hypothetical protein AMTRI_Chr01g111730 [Amborella trichopoda]